MNGFDTNRFRRVVDVAKAANASHLRQLPLALIDPDPNQPRKAFEDLDDFAASIKAHGIVQPITVMPAGDRFRLVYGERRYRASVKAGLTTIPALVEPEKAPNRRERQLIENLHRADLSPIDIGNAIKALLAEASTAEVAKALGKPKGWVSQHAAISDMPVALMRLLTSGSPLRAVYDLHVAAKKEPAILTAAEALESVTVAEAWRLIHGPAASTATQRSDEVSPPSIQRVEAIALTAPAPTSVPQSCPPSATAITTSPAVPQPQHENARVAALETRIGDALGVKVCVMATGNEHLRVLIEVASLDELEEMARRLCRR